MPASFIAQYRESDTARFDIGPFKWSVKKLGGKWTAVSPRGDTHVTFVNWERAILWAADWS